MQSTTTSSTEPKEMPACTCTVEQELARLGARIDKLIARANETKQAVQAKVEDLGDKTNTARKRGGAALHEMKSGLDKAWNDLNQAWQELKIGTERAVQQLKPEASAEDIDDIETHPPVPCGCPKHQLDTEEDVESII